MREKISVVVPVYGVENVLGRCVDSILAQTYENLEIILVDDGSPDRCPAICEDYARKDERIRVVHKENGGLTSAWKEGSGMPRQTGSALWTVTTGSNRICMRGSGRRLPDIRQISLWQDWYLTMKIRAIRPGGRPTGWIGLSMTGSSLKICFRYF